jgi:hypothetical protein
MTRCSSGIFRSEGTAERRQESEQSVFRPPGAAIDELTAAPSGEGCNAAGFPATWYLPGHE